MGKRGQGGEQRTLHGMSNWTFVRTKRVSPTAQFFLNGNIIAGKTEGRTSEEQITVADLTGVAVQDIQIACAVYEHHK